MTTTKPTRKALETEINRLTPDEQALALRLARAVWEYIGADVMRAVADSGSKRTSIPRAEVVEVVLDAGRYVEQIDHEIRVCRAIAPNYEEKDRLSRLGILRGWFDGPDAASYAARCALVGRAFDAREG